MNAELLDARRDVGASAALWAGSAGSTREPFGWAAFSGVRSTNYNVVLCDAPDDALDAAVSAVAAARVPAILMVAGRALGEVQRLVRRDWVCIGATPLMRRALHDLDPVAPDPLVRALALPDLPAAREIVAEVFHMPAGQARVGLPDMVADPSGPFSAWGAFDRDGTLRCCLCVARVDDRCVVWSMATAEDARGRGYGARTLLTALGRAAADGVVDSLLCATPSGEAFYPRLGYAEIDRWQMWSRPRWVLGRA